MKNRVDNLLKIMQRQALHAKTLGFYHPHLKKEVFFDSELPDDMVNAIKKNVMGSFIFVLIAFFNLQQANTH